MESEVVDFNYKTLNEQELATDTQLAEGYLNQLIDVLMVDDENQQNQIAIQQLLHVSSLLETLRMAYFGRLSFNDGTYSYGDECTAKEIDALEAYLNGEDDD